MIFSGVAIGAISTFRLLGGAVATAMYSSIVDNQFAQNLPGRVQQAIAGTDFDTANLRSLIAAAATNTAAAYARVPDISQEIISLAQVAVRQAYVQAFRIVYYTALGFAVLAIISALCVSDVDPAKKNFDKAVHLENEKSTKMVDEESKVHA